MTTEMIELGDVVKVDRTPATDDACRILPFVGLEHIEKDTGTFVSDYRRVPEALLATKFRFTSQHVLYSKLRPNLNKVLFPRFDGVCTTEMLPLIPKNAAIDTTYLYFLLQSPSFVTWATHSVSGANLPRLDPKTLQEFSFHLPSMINQRTAVGTLLRAQALRRMRRYALQMCDEFQLNLFRENLGVCKKQITQLGDICLRITDGVHITPTYVSNGFPFLRVTDIQDDEIDWTRVKRIPRNEYDDITRRSKPEYGDILYSKNGTIGIAKEITWRVPFAHFVSLALLKPNRQRVYSSFLTAWLNTADAIKQATGHSKTGTVTNLHLNEIIKIMVPLPSLGEQQKLVEFIDSAKSLRAIHVEALRQADHLFQTLLHQCFCIQ